MYRQSSGARKSGLRIIEKGPRRILQGPSAVSRIEPIDASGTGWPPGGASTALGGRRPRGRFRAVCNPHPSGGERAPPAFSPRNLRNQRQAARMGQSTVYPHPHPNQIPRPFRFGCFFFEREKTPRRVKSLTGRCVFF